MTAPWAATRVTRALGVRYPLVQGPFGGGLSSSALTAAVSNGGGLGSFGANWLSPLEIRALVSQLRGLTDAPFNVNLWVPLASDRAPRRVTDADVERLRPYYEALDLPVPGLALDAVPVFVEQLEALLESAPPVVSFVFGVPPREFLDEARRRAMVTVGTATTVAEARMLEAAGVDVIIASGSDAGGHRGAFLQSADESLVGTLSLVPQVVDAVSVPVIAAGGIADARQIRACFALGADGVQIGTAFFVTDESAASAAHKAALASDEAETTVLTNAFTGRLARAVPNTLSRGLSTQSRRLPPYPAQSQLTAPLRRAATGAGRSEFLNLWAGQSARLARPRSAADLLAALVRELDDDPGFKPRA